MSAIVCLKQNDELILATDSRIMEPDFSAVASDHEEKVFEVAPGVFIAGAGWKPTCDFEVKKSRELAIHITDVRRLAEAMEVETVPQLERLVERLRAECAGVTQVAGVLRGDLLLHVTAIAGRNASGKLGFTVRRYRVIAARVVAEAEEYFGMERRVFVNCAEVVTHIAMTSPEFIQRVLSGPPASVVPEFLARLRQACNLIGGDDQVVSIDRTGVRWISPHASNKASACATKGRPGSAAIPVSRTRRSPALTLRSQTATFSSSVTLQVGSSGPYMQLTSTSLLLQSATYSKIELDNAGNATFTGTGGTSTVINGNSIGTGFITAEELVLAGTSEIILAAAVVGGGALPSSATGFIQISIGGVSRLVPFF